MVVSNRTDKPLEQRIAKDFHAKITWVVNKQRRVQSAAGSLSKGRFDMLILLTGFLDHSTVKILEDACKDTTTTVVKANRGRPTAIQLAVERDDHE